MEAMEAVESRERVARWIEEGQYVVGRVIPGLLDQHERLRGTAELAERECMKLREEINELGKQIGWLQSENRHLLQERVDAVEKINEFRKHVGWLQSEKQRLLQEREDIAGAINKVWSQMIQLMDEVRQRLHGPQ